MKKRAFTLIELLVVISIIAVLMSIMMPALQKARTQAKILICGSNVKTISQSTMLYVEDNNKKFPTKGIGPDGRYNTKDDFYWDDAIFPYINNYEVYSCPVTITRYRDAVKKIATDISGVEKYKYPGTIRFNTWLQGWDPYNTAGRPWPVTHSETVTPIPFQLSQVKKTANVVMFADGSGVAGNEDGIRRLSYFYNGAVRYMPDIMPAHEIKLKNNGVTIPFHTVPECSGGVNLGFVDGHLEKISRFEYTKDTVDKRTPPREGLYISPTGREWR